MPSIFQQDIDNYGSLAVWSIREDASFFLEKVLPQRDVHHPHKQLQHLAGRYILVHLFPEFPVSLIRIADTRKPYLEQDPYHFSISHCDDFAAAIVSSRSRVGIDIESFSDKALRIRPKYCGPDEWTKAMDQWGSLLAPVQLSTTIWSCKEAVFKWYGLGGVDFKENILLDEFITPEEEHRLQVRARFSKEISQELLINVRLFDEFCLAWVVS